MFLFFGFFAFGLIGCLSILFVIMTLIEWLFSRRFSSIFAYMAAIAMVVYAGVIRFFASPEAPLAVTLAFGLIGLVFWAFGWSEGRRFRSDRSLMSQKNTIQVEY